MPAQDKNATTTKHDSAAYRQVRFIEASFDAFSILRRGVDYDAIPQRTVAERECPSRGLKDAYALDGIRLDAEQPLKLILGCIRSTGFGIEDGRERRQIVL